MSVDRRTTTDHYEKEIERLKLEVEELYYNRSTVEPQHISKLRKENYRYKMTMERIAESRTLERCVEIARKTLEMKCNE